MNTMFKIGDRVKVRSDLVVSEAYYIEDNRVYHKFVYPMKEYSGKVVTIELLFFGKDSFYKIKEDYHNWYWTEEMFEPRIEIKLSAERFLS